MPMPNRQPASFLHLSPCRLGLAAHGTVLLDLYSAGIPLWRLLVDEAREATYRCRDVAIAMEAGFLPDRPPATPWWGAQTGARQLPSTARWQIDSSSSCVVLWRCRSLHGTVGFRGRACPRKVAPGRSTLWWRWHTRLGARRVSEVALVTLVFQFSGPVFGSSFGNELLKRLGP